MKSLRSLDEAGHNMVYLLIRTFCLHYNKPQTTTKIFELPYQGEIINTNDSNSVDIQYDLKLIPSHLQNILKIFVFRHSNMMNELTHTAEQASIARMSF